MSWLLRPLRWFPESWALIDEEAAEARNARGGGVGLDGRAAQVLVLSAVLLTVQWYWGDRPYFQGLFGKAILSSPRSARYLDLISFSWWSGAKLLGLVLAPAIHIWLLGGRLRDFGLPLTPRTGAEDPRHGVGKWLYFVLFGGVLPLVALASFSPAFQQTYPFYRQAGRSWFDFLCWELQYGATFLAFEFFFRGYMLFGLVRALGSHAIFVMVVPYCMIHALKPASESLGAIIAGVVLGTLALRTRSIWYGVMIHVSVAWSMDLLSSWQTRGFPPPGRLWP